MKYTQTSLKNQTATYEIILTTKDIASRYKTALDRLAKDITVEGFRKGKAPLDRAEKQIGKERIYDTLLQEALPDVYKQIIAEDKLKPVIAPKVELKSAKEGEDWTIIMTIALQPIVKVPDYRAIAKNARAEAKKNDIWVPGKDSAADAADSDGKADTQAKEKYLNSLLQTLIDKTTIELSDVIVEHEVNQRLSRLLDDVRKIGLTIDAYFQSRNTDQEKVKNEFKKDILNTYKLEYALNEIGDAESITVESKEIEALIDSIPDEKGRDEARQNAYVYGSMLRKQKILDFLGGL